ncbi:RluA family pseudouridine synthase [Paenibacillus sp. IB182496]|uniref:Pseudouridine synthase n=1 Tax=Paenibacillus sabuli TaxID=2772509 RepID=A0A927GSQ4_9BACL|nr:RluA family pseudouridine synthase [Paenibacillus sabuli]MBD2846270.1 RluA family pseudouridine synthase [Paenibacillus sabuli]
MNQTESSQYSDEAEEWVVSAGESGERLDKLIVELVKEEGASRTLVQDWIRAGHVEVNQAPAKANQRLAEGDQIRLSIPEPQHIGIVPEAIPLDIVHEDADVIVINKPRGMVVHPAPGHSSGTLVHALMHHCGELPLINGEYRPGIVHRIDKDTTGLLMAAKNDRAHHLLSEQLRLHSVTRKYIALVHGNLPHDQGTIDAPIGRDPKDRKLFTVTDRASRDAVSHFLVLERLDDYTLLELQLETGRTHQIRVHMKYIGYPLAGDPVYGRSKTVALNGQALHAAVLGFDHPSDGRRLQFEAPLPADFEHVLTALRNR